MKPPPSTQIGALHNLLATANALETVLAATVAANAVPGVKKQQDARSIPEAIALVAAISNYGSTYGATGLDLMDDGPTSLRNSAGYTYLKSKNLHIDFETRVLTQQASFSTARIRAILSQMARFSTEPAFEEKIKRAIDTNRFWSPNDGYFWELEDLASIHNISFVEVPVNGKVIDMLLGDGTLVDQKFEAVMDPKNPTVLKQNIQDQLTAMQQAKATSQVIHGIMVKDFRFHVRTALTADVQAYLAAHGLTPHFVVR